MGNRDYDKLFAAGTAAQREKLVANEHKDGFLNLDMDFAFESLTKERDELLIAFEMRRLSRQFPYIERSGKTALKAIRCEAADVANFAHMIILKCDKELEK